MLSLILFLLFLFLSIGTVGFMFSLPKTGAFKALFKKKLNGALYFKQKLRLSTQFGELTSLEAFFFSPYGFVFLLFLILDVGATLFLTRQSSYYDHLSGSLHITSIIVFALMLVLLASCYRFLIVLSSQLSSTQRFVRISILLGCCAFVFIPCRSISQDISNLIQGPRYGSGIVSELSFSSPRRSASRIATIGTHKYKTVHKEWFNQLQNQKGQEIDYIHDPAQQLIFPPHDPRLSSIGLSLVIFHSLIWLLILGFSLRGYLCLKTALG